MEPALGCGLVLVLAAVVPVREGGRPMRAALRTTAFAVAGRGDLGALGIAAGSAAVDARISWPARSRP